jgi:hypothetical protein
MKRSHRVLLVLAIIIVAGVTMPQSCARQGALSFGGGVIGALSEVSKSEFKNTAALMEFFEMPEIADAAHQAERWDLLNFGYARRIDALKRGMIYLSQQASLPESERLASPPEVTPYSLQTGNKTDQGLFDATLALALEFRLSL